ncbi:hypothetical protein AVEN_202257-1 [Araneus ventricosus]|uniref:Uncharacterized protein n=1 Tax=Araneus ventricosus TaxID=182803 RepID=A0A4Y2CNY7_ARAVE|nr:hypothetical protein AVEN_202257-1 [Araneus ventricosus]
MRHLICRYSLKPVTVSQADEIDELVQGTSNIRWISSACEYMGAVGKIMGVSGLEEVWYEVFAKNVVAFMPNGLTYTRTLRARSLSQLAIAHLTLEYCEEDDF